MAKNKNKNKSKGQQQPVMSPERFMQEKVRSLPIGKCYITPEWKESGISQVIISRVRPSGNLSVGIFLVDTFCIGVKDAMYYSNMSELEFEKLIKRYESELGLESISYDEAHNIIYGAIEFAKEGGIQPAKDFRIAGYILEEDTDDIQLIEYEFGKDGKHYLVINSDKREMPYFHQLKKTLGNDFEYLMDSDEGLENEDIEECDNDFDRMIERISAKDIKMAMDNWQKSMDESGRHPDEIYSYDYPEYPKSLEVKHQFIVDELMSKDNLNELPKTVIDRILAIPHDEAAEDIVKIVMYEIGRTYKAINDKTIGEFENGAILHAICLLTQLKIEKGIDAVLEVLRQNGDFLDYHLGDLVPELIHPALYACGLNKIPEIVAYINQPGLDYYVKYQAFNTLTMIVFLHPERREEIIEVLRKILKSWVTRLPKQEACDGHLAGLVMVNLIELKAKELIPEIKAVFETDCVDKSIMGDCNTILDSIQNAGESIDPAKYTFPDIYEQYARIKSFTN